MNCKKELFLDLPYPPLCVTEQNPEIARWLFPLYAGASGELTAISQYIYQSIVTGDTDPVLSDALECIAVTEMKHFSMLGKLIQMLGANPLLCSPSPHNRRCRPWSSAYLTYRQEPSRFLSENVCSEEEAAQAYEHAAACISDPHVSAVLRRIAQDELHHADIFRNWKSMQKEPK